MESKNTRVNWVYIAVFYLIAFGISAPFNSGHFSQDYQSWAKEYLICDWTFLPAGVGTLISAGLAYFFYQNHNRTISFFGNDRYKNIAIALTPLFVFSLVGLNNENQVNQNYYGFIFATVALIYALSEEVFWRGFLQDALLPHGNIWRYTIIGVLWWAWHFRFTATFDFTWFLFICIGSTFLLGKFAEETKSFLTTAGLHSLIILTTTSGEMTNSKIIGGVLTIFIWIGIGKYWNTGIAKPG